MGLFDKIKQGLQKTSDAVNRSLDNVFAAFVKIDADLLEELEEALILSDVGAVVIFWSFARFSTSATIFAEVSAPTSDRMSASSRDRKSVVDGNRVRP